MPLRNEWGSIASIALLLRQSAKPEVIPLPSPPVPQRKPEPCPHIHARIGERIVVAEALPIRRRLPVAGIFIGRS
jgi:hypothetical protein